MFYLVYLLDHSFKGHRVGSGPCSVTAFGFRHPCSRFAHSCYYCPALGCLFVCLFLYVERVRKAKVLMALFSPLRSTRNPLQTPD